MDSEAVKHDGDVSFYIARCRDAFDRLACATDYTAFPRADDSTHSMQAFIKLLLYRVDPSLSMCLHTFPMAEMRQTLPSRSSGLVRRPYLGRDVQQAYDDGCSYIMLFCCSIVVSYRCKRTAKTLRR